MSELKYTPLEDIPKIHAELRKGFLSGKSRPVAYRKEQLLHLAYLLKDNQKRFQDAMREDMGRHAVETDFFEIGPVLTDIKHTYNRVDKWAKTENTPFSPYWFAMNPKIRKEPKGLVLIISPFNFPIFLLLGPFIGAIASGSAALLKPSELTPKTSALFAELFPKYLDQDLYRIVNGGIPETTEILKLPFDHILYTGNGRVARIVCEAAAKHLTPVSTELGGKSPVIIDPSCDIKTTARRLLWGKVSNAGQMCIAPDYVLVPREFQDTLVEALREAHKSFFPNGTDTTPDFARLVSTQHTQRLKRLLDATKGRVVIGGKTDVDTKYIAPTVVADVQPDDSLMSEELFGPILPILPVKDIDEAIRIVNSLDNPLALYLFSSDEKVKQKVLDNTRSGGVGINEIAFHVAVDGLPFGGDGASGNGYHTGKFSFDMFTHLRGQMENPTWTDSFLKGRFPPFHAKSLRILNRMLNPPLPPRPGTQAASGGSGKYLALASLIGVGASVAWYTSKL